MADGGLASESPGVHDDLLLVDSTPVECARSREAVKRSALGDAADYGYCGSHSRFFWGFRPHAILAPDETPRGAHGGFPIRASAQPLVGRSLASKTSSPGLSLGGRRATLPVVARLAGSRRLERRMRSQMSARPFGGLWRGVCAGSGSLSIGRTRPPPGRARYSQLPKRARPASDHSGPLCSSARCALT